MGRRIPAPPRSAARRIRQSTRPDRPGRVRIPRPRLRRRAPSLLARATRRRPDRPLFLCGADPGGPTPEAMKRRGPAPSQNPEAVPLALRQYARGGAVPFYPFYTVLKFKGFASSPFTRHLVIPGSPVAFFVARPPRRRTGTLTRPTAPV